MTKYWPNTQLTLRTTVTNNGALADPATIEFRWKLFRDGQWNSVTPVEVSTGIFEASFTPTFGGPLYWQWKTTGPAVSEEGHFLVEGSQFDNTGQGWCSDYGMGNGGYW